MAEAVPNARPDGESLAGRTVSILMARAATGDRESCAALVERIDPLLMVYVKRQVGAQLGSRYDAGDLVNDAWARILPRLADIQPSDGRLTRAFLKYAATVINNRIRDLVRARKEEAMPPSATASTDSQSHSATRHEPRDDGPSVISVAVRHEVHERLRQVIETLSDRDREIILLRGIGQKSNDDVAAELDVQLGHRRRALPPRARPPSDAPSDVGVRRSLRRGRLTE